MPPASTALPSRGDGGAAAHCGSGRRGLYPFCLLLWLQPPSPRPPARGQGRANVARPPAPQPPAVPTRSQTLHFQPTSRGWRRFRPPVSHRTPVAKRPAASRNTKAQSWNEAHMQTAPRQRARGGRLAPMWPPSSSHPRTAAPPRRDPGFGPWLGAVSWAHGEPWAARPPRRGWESPDAAAASAATLRASHV